MGEESYGNFLYGLLGDQSIVSNENGDLFVRNPWGPDRYTTAAGTKRDWLLRQYGDKEIALTPAISVVVPAYTVSPASPQSVNVVSAPSGAEWYDREWRAIKLANPDWTDNQVTAKMSETIWNNNYKALMDDIAHSSSPEEREQKIRDHQWELDNYKASGIDVDNDEQYLRDKQGMPSKSIFNKVISTYVASHVEYPYSVDPGSLVDVDAPEGLSIEGQKNFQAQKQDDEATAYNSIQKDVESLKQFFEKVGKDSELQREYSEKKRQERNQPVGDFMDALMVTPAGPAVKGVDMLRLLKGLGILFKEGSNAKYLTKIEGAVTRIETADLPEWITKSFTDGNYRTVVTNDSITLYRTFGGKADAGGGFATTIQTANRIQAKIDTALLPEWGNTRMYEAVIVIPKGQVLNIGKIAEQYTNAGTKLFGQEDQILLPQNWPLEWIKEVRVVPSK